MSCLVAAAQLGLDQDLRHVLVAGPLLDLPGRGLRFLDVGADRPPPPLVPVVVAVQPVVGLPVVQRRAHRRVGLGDAGGVRRGLEDGDVCAGLHDQLFEGQIRVAARELAIGGKGVDAHGVGVGVVGRVIVDLLADGVGSEVLAAPWLREILTELAPSWGGVDV
jgi:hypothetical protein